MAYLSDRNADRCSARHDRAIMRAYCSTRTAARSTRMRSGTTIPHAAEFIIGRAFARPVGSCGLHLLLVRNGTTRNPEQCTVLDSGSAPTKSAVADLDNDNAELG